MAAMENTLKGVEVMDATKAKLISKRKLIQLPQWAVAWIVLIPALIFITMFMLYPIINTFLYAFIQDFAYVKRGGSFALSQFFAGLEKGDMKLPSFEEGKKLNGFEAFSLAYDSLVRIIE